MAFCSRFGKWAFRGLACRDLVDLRPTYLYFLKLESDTQQGSRTTALRQYPNNTSNFLWGEGLWGDRGMSLHGSLGT